MTEEELDRETERMLAAARAERPAGALRERVMQGVTRGERARARARRLATLGWAAVAAGVGGLLWLSASEAGKAPDRGAEPERVRALNPVPDIPSAGPQPDPSAAVVTPPVVSPSSSAPQPEANAATTTSATRVAPRLRAPAPAPAEPAASPLPERSAPPAPPPPDPERALEERK